MQNNEQDNDLCFININDDKPSDSEYSLSESEFEGENEYISEYGDDDENEDSGKSKFFHIAFLFIALIFLILIVVLLIKWSKGHDLVLDPNAQNDFDIETMDFYIHYDPTEVEGYQDDGELNIVILGDDSMLNYEDETSIPSIIAKKTGGNVTTCALEGGVIATKVKGYSLDYTEDAYSLFYQATQITGGSDGSYDLMMAAWDYMDDPTKYYNYWDILHKVPFKRADVIIISYGINDYLDGFPILGDEVAPNQIYGLGTGTCAALNDVLVSMKNKFPYAQILVVSPTMIKNKDKNGNMKGADMVNTGNGTLGEYVAELAYFAGLNSVTFVDNYLGTPFNPDTYESYLEEDGRTPNAEARQMLADHIIDNFYFNRDNNVSDEK